MNLMLQICCMLQLMLAIYVSSTTTTTTTTTCGYCMDNGVACLNHVEFTTCHNGQTTQNLLTCGPNERCTASAEICQPQDSHEPLVCPYSGACNICTHSNGRFACLNETHYGFCYGHYTPHLQGIGECPENYICSALAIKEVCLPSAHYQPSCIDNNSYGSY